jgi:hypothetical protein
VVFVISVCRRSLLATLSRHDPVCPRLVLPPTPPRRSLELLRTHRDALDRLTEMLLTEETVDGRVVLATLSDTERLPSLQPTGQS